MTNKLTLDDIMSIYSTTQTILRSTIEMMDDNDVFWDGGEIRIQGENGNTYNIYSGEEYEYVNLSNLINKRGPDCDCCETQGEEMALEISDEGKRITKAILAGLVL